MVEGRIISSIDLRSDQTANLHNDIIRRSRQCTFLHAETVLGDGPNSTGWAVGIGSVSGTSSTSRRLVTIDDSDVNTKLERQGHALTFTHVELAGMLWCILRLLLRVLRLYSAQILVRLLSLWIPGV